jgi:hypothetical protein
MVGEYMVDVRGAELDEEEEEGISWSLLITGIPRRGDK